MVTKYKVLLLIWTAGLIQRLGLTNDSISQQIEIIFGNIVQYD